MFDTTFGWVQLSIILTVFVLNFSGWLLEIYINGNVIKELVKMYIIMCLKFN